MAFSWFCIVLSTVGSFAFEPTCMLQMAPPDSMNHVNTLEIAVYTENIGDYEKVRTHDIPSVPPGMDAFYFADPLTLDKNKDAFALWRKKGWKTIRYRDMEKGTQQVSGQRLTAKKIRFDPPDWMTQGEWNWLIHFDAGKYFLLEQLPSFIQKRSNATLILKNWCNLSPGCCSQGGFACFQAEVKKLQGRERDRIKHSRKEYDDWVSDVTKMVKNSTLSLPHYFELNIFMRNLKSKYSGEVKKAFNEVFDKNRKVPRDQPFLPVFLEKHHLNAEIITVSHDELEQELGFKSASERAISNFMSDDVGRKGPFG